MFPSLIGNFWLPFHSRLKNGCLPIILFWSDASKEESCIYCIITSKKVSKFLKLSNLFYLWIPIFFSSVSFLYLASNLNEVGATKIFLLNLHSSRRLSICFLPFALFSLKVPTIKYHSKIKRKKFFLHFWNFVGLQGIVSNFFFVLSKVRV